MELRYNIMENSPWCGHVGAGRPRKSENKAKAQQSSGLGFAEPGDIVKVCYM